MSATAAVSAAHPCKTEADHSMSLVRSFSLPEPMSVATLTVFTAFVVPLSPIHFYFTSSSPCSAAWREQPLPRRLLRGCWVPHLRVLVWQWGPGFEASQWVPDNVQVFLELVS